MKRFLDQFLLVGALRTELEHSLYNTADNIIVGYNGASWVDAKEGNCTFAVMAGDPRDRIQVQSLQYFEARQTDRRTASLAVCHIAVNHFWHRNFRRFQVEEVQKAFRKFHDDVRDAAYGDSSSVDQDTFFYLTD